MASGKKQKRDRRTVQVIVPVQVSRGASLKDYIGESVEEVRESFRVRKGQSLDQEVRTGAIELYRGRVVI